MKGLLSLAMIAGVAILFIGGSFLFAFFTGGTQSTGLFGWGDNSLLAGVEVFITGVYNIVIVIASWVTILVLLVVFFGIQAGFVYVYYRIAKIALHFREDVDRIMDEILDI